MKGNIISSEVLKRFTTAVIKGYFISDKKTVDYGVYKIITNNITFSVLEFFTVSLAHSFAVLSMLIYFQVIVVVVVGLVVVVVLLR